MCLVSVPIPLYLGTSNTHSSEPMHHPRPIPVSNSQYRVHHDAPIVGKGSYATVMRAEDTDAPALSLVAKVTNLNTVQRRSTWHNEHCIYAALGNAPQHPHLVQCKGHYIINNHGVIILERFKGVTLEEHVAKVGPLSVPDMLNALDQIAAALHWLHARNIAMRDLKPENIAYDAATRTCKLFDFGLAIILPYPEATITQFVGSPLYMPPEVLRTNMHDPVRADLWSLGQTVFYMLTGRTMFGFCLSMPELQCHVFRCAYVNTVYDHIKESKLSLEQENLVLGLCAYQPSMRWDLARVAQWLGKQDDDMCLQ